MSNAQHTPGPWYIAGEDEAIVGVPCIEIMHGECPSPECQTICYVDCDFINDEHILTKKNYANAYLIAAAPELLRALENVCKEFDVLLGISGLGNGAIDKARIVIAKAKGA